MVKVERVNVTPQMIDEYIGKGPENHKAEIKELMNDINQLFEAMQVLVMNKPMTTIVEGLRIKLTVSGRGGEIANFTIGGMACEKGYEPTEEEMERHAREG